MMGYFFHLKQIITLNVVMVYSFLFLKMFRLRNNFQEKHRMDRI